MRVEIFVVAGDVDVDFAFFGGFDAFEFGGFVVALCTPGDIVGVAEGVDVQNVDVGGREEKVLNELCGVSLSMLLPGIGAGRGQATYTCEHVPWVKEHEGSYKVQDIC